MKLTVSLLAITLIALLPNASINAQSSPSRPRSAGTPGDSQPAGSPGLSPAPMARTDVYHVHFVKAAAGKAKDLADDLKKPDPQDPMPGHALILRHQEGDSWDYAVIQHMGTKATIEASRPAPSPAVRNMSDWHNDTYVNGPSWGEFTKAMGIDDAGKSKTGSVYVISVYRPAAGHREQLEQMLSEPPTSGDTVAGNVLMQHLEGGPWTFLTIARYDSWQDFGKSESNAVTALSKNEGGWFKLRDHASYHTDTVADRIFP